MSFFSRSIHSWKQILPASWSHAFYWQEVEGLYWISCWDCYWESLPGQTISLIEIHREKLIIYHLSVHWICLLYLLYTSPDSQQNPKDQQCFWSWPGITISVTLSPPWRSFSILMTVHNLTRTPTGLKRNPRLKWKAYIRCHRKRWLQNRQFLVSSIKIKLTLIVILYLYKSQINFDRVQKIFT